MRLIVCLLLAALACRNPGEPVRKVRLDREAVIRDRMRETGAFQPPDLRRADSIILAAERFAESVGDSAVAAEIRASIPMRTYFEDSVRYNRAIDRVAVTVEIARGGVPQDALERYFPTYTPGLAWARIGSKGVHFQPVNSVQVVVYPIPKPWHGPTKKLTMVADAMWRYAIPSPLGPRWEYDFDHSSGNYYRAAGWQSALAQSYAMMLFGECYRRTGDAVWRERALAVLPTLTAPWHQGGVRLADTTHGYWLEEFHPDVRVFNGAAQAAMHLLTLAQVLPDEPAVQHAARRSAEAVLYYAPLYDDGVWTRYSLTQGWNSVDYHQAHVEFMRELAVLADDPRFSTIADRWAAFARPF